MNEMQKLLVAAIQTAIAQQTREFNRVKDRYGEAVAGGVSDSIKKLTLLKNTIESGGLQLEMLTDGNKPTKK